MQNEYIQLVLINKKNLTQTHPEMIGRSQLPTKLLYSVDIQTETIKN
jgi:hypothetical protein